MLSAFANSSGGLIVWGVDARPNDDGVDCAVALREIPRVALLLTRLNELDGLAVNPIVGGVRHRIIPSAPGSENGYAATLVPESDAGPHMAKMGDDRYGQFREYLKQFNLAHVTAYHQRHAFISDRLRAGVSPVMIAAHCGTSIRMISQTYSHITGLEASKEIAKKPYVYGVG